VYLGQRDVPTVGASGSVRLSKRPLQGARVRSKPKTVGPTELVNSNGGAA
jgi:hypothetical protein